MRFNILDAALIALLLLSAYLGYRGGPLKKFITLLATIAAVVVGMRLMSPLGGPLSRLGVFSASLSYVIVFLVLVTILLAATYVLYRRFGKKSSAGNPGKALAAGLGVIEAGFLISVLLILLKLVELPGSSLRTGSLLYSPMVNLAPVSFDALKTAVPDGGELRQLSREHPPKP